MHKWMKKGLQGALGGGGVGREKRSKVLLIGGDGWGSAVWGGIVWKAALCPLYV